MPGMRNGLNATNSVLEAAFRTALMHQGLLALLLFFLLAGTWITTRELTQRGRIGLLKVAEAPARTLLRFGFGVLWVFDGILQGQPAMPAAMPSKVIAPVAADSPHWAQHLVNWAGTAWSYHPIQVAAAAVWIQLGIGIWLLAAARGPWSRLAGAASAAWGVLVWVFGEVFGGLFSSGQSLLFGTPGAVAFYCVAGVLIALPDRAWQQEALGRRLLAWLGVFFAAMAVLQAWPGDGFWHGTARAPTALTDMLTSMSGTPQPAPLARLVGDFATLSASHSFWINAIVVATLAGIGLGLSAGRGRVLRVVVVVTAVFCLADWVIVQDLGFLGGLGTDPNSMIPLLLLVLAGYLGLRRPGPAPVPAPATAPDSAPTAAQPRPARAPSWREQLRPARLARAFASASAGSVVALWAAVLVLIGATPMALAQANGTADPIIAEALDGATAPLHTKAPSFQLTNVSGRPVSLASLRGKVLLLTFLDPVCTTDCPLLAQELREADQLLGAKAGSVELVAIATNPLYYTTPYLRAFDQQEDLTGVRNWLFLTGPLGQLRRVWADYGISAVALPGGQMVAHNDLVVVIDRAGQIRDEINADPGPGTATSRSSFAVVFAQAAARAIAASSSSS